jgi:hypothetical protein
MPSTSEYLRSVYTTHIAPNVLKLTANAIKANIIKTKALTGLGFQVVEVPRIYK